MARRGKVTALRAIALLSAWVLVFFAASAASAADPSRLVRNDFDIQVFQGPIIAPNRIIGLAGANAADPEGATGDYANAAAPAVRTPYSINYIDYDLTGGISFPGAFSRTDFENRGEGQRDISNRFGSFLLLNGGGTLQYGPFGASATADVQSVTLDSTASGNGTVDLRLLRWRALAAYALFDHQFIVGGGVRGITLQLTEPFPSSRALLTMTGIGPEVGVLVRPNDYPFRFGGTVRLPVSGRIVGSSLSGASDDFVLTVGDYVLPNRVRLPWEVEVGGALQLGPRPLNPKWRNPRELEARVRTELAIAQAERKAANARRIAIAPPAERRELERDLAAYEDAIRRVEGARLDAEVMRVRASLAARYGNWPRERVLLMASVLMTGGQDGAISIQSFVDQRKEPFGASMTLSPRVGVESEPIVNAVRARIGSYFEPSRFHDGHARQHFTFGGDVRLFNFDPFDWWGDFTLALTLSLDLAPRFTNWGLGLGAWH